jgi:hypothetical protein
MAYEVDLLDAHVPVIDPGARGEQPDARTEPVNNLGYVVMRFDPLGDVSNVLAITAYQNNIGGKITSGTALILDLAASAVALGAAFNGHFGLSPRKAGDYYDGDKNQTNFCPRPHLVSCV